MTVWWGLAGLLGLLGLCGLIRSHRADGTAVEADPLERYPAAREPAMPNADAAHTPLMTPAITPEMLARPALPREEPAAPESGRIAGEIPSPRPVGDRPAAPGEVPAAGLPAGAWGGMQAAGGPGEVSAGAWDGVRSAGGPGEGSAGARGGVRAVGAPAAVEQTSATAVPSAVAQSAGVPVEGSAGARDGVRAVGAPAAAEQTPAAAVPSAAAQPAGGESGVGTFGAPVTAPAPVVQHQRAPQPRASDEVSPQPKHALRPESVENPAPETSRVPQTRSETAPEAPRKETSPPPERGSRGLVGLLKRVLGRS
ncbi:hypothetical protein [Amycolatopsis sp. NPDC003731]